MGHEGIDLWAEIHHLAALSSISGGGLAPFTAEDKAYFGLEAAIAFRIFGRVLKDFICELWAAD